jgi:hypothetical protein
MDWEMEAEVTLANYFAVVVPWSREQLCFDQRRVDNNGMSSELKQLN